MKKKEDLRVRKTKANLYKGLLQLMENRTFEDIKVTDICKISMINRSTFYDHFNDKFELLASLIEDLKEELSEHLKVYTNTKNIKEYYLEIIKLLLTYIHKNLSLYSALAVIKKNNNSIAQDMIFDASLKEVTQTLKENYKNHSNIPTETIALFYVSGVIKVLIDSVKEPSSFDEEKLLNQLEKLIPDLDYLEPIKD